MTGLDRTTMVAVVDDLERLGYAHREQSTTDRRKRVVSPTRSGLRMLADAAIRPEKAERELFRTPDGGGAAPAGRARRQAVHARAAALLTFLSAAAKAAA